MNENILTLLIQTPLLGVFIWYSLQLQARYERSLQARDEQFEKRNTALVAAIAELTKQIAGLHEDVSVIAKQRQRSKSSSQ